MLLTDTITLIELARALVASVGVLYALMLAFDANRDLLVLGVPFVDIPQEEVLARRALAQSHRLLATAIAVTLALQAFAAGVWMTVPTSHRAEETVIGVSLVIAKLVLVGALIRNQRQRKNVLDDEQALATARLAAAAHELAIRQEMQIAATEANTAQLEALTTTIKTDTPPARDPSSRTRRSDREGQP